MWITLNLSQLLRSLLIHLQSILEAERRERHFGRRFQGKSLVPGVSSAGSAGETGVQSRSSKVMAGSRGGVAGPGQVGGKVR